jgi:phenol hydroxylase P5 protein
VSDLVIRQARVGRIREAGPAMRQVELESTDGPLPYRAGQWLAFQVAPGEPGSKGIWRVYSLCSAPSEAAAPVAPEAFAVLAATDSGGPGAGFFAGLAEGDTVRYHGPYGKFTLADDDASPIWLAADGVGIGPVRSLVQAILAGGAPPPVTLVHEAVVPHALAFRGEFEGLAQDVDELTYLPTVPGADSDWHGETRDLSELVPALAPADGLSRIRWYLCGSGRRTDRLGRWLSGAGVPEDRIRVERFFD